MKLTDPGIDRVCDELDFISALPLDGARVLELGCGAAEKTRLIAGLGRINSLLALEVDQRQHAKNLLIADLPNVTFALGGAEKIELPDSSVDIVFLFKSLHHVPDAQLDNALAEIGRVLKPNGLAYISEPVFAGDYNEVLRLFHDEEYVRARAFAAMQRAVASGALRSQQQIFFNGRVRFKNFERFEEKVLNVTHTEHRLSPELHAQVRARFDGFMGPEGVTFYTPMRVDILQKPAAR